MFKKLVAAAGIAVAGMAAATAHAEDMPKQLNFGIISTESSSALESSFGPFLEDMSKSLGVTVKPFFASDYAGVIEGMRFGKVDVAWFGNKSAIQAVDRAGGEVFAQTIKDDGSKGYYSLLITHKDSGINSLEDVLKCDKTLTFGNGDPNSTSGFAIPGYYVWALNNKTPEECFSRVVNSNHEGNALAVANQKVDVATNNTESIYARLAKSNPEAAANIKEIWRSPMIPSDPIVWRKDLSKVAKEKIYYFFMQYGRFGDVEKVKREREILANVSDGWGPFLASSNAQLLDVRQIEAFKAKLKAQNNDKLSDDEKKAAIKAAEKELKELQSYAKIVGPAGY
ncbi:phosphonate ABC transporter substrate-binding protein [Hwanghaeella grinnelliae]|uniref:Phosphonate ABC transporter substrate-binding protein n=1 Tax=Hwanghaeella grinnelliae TaxID=2500179 RepID=A0A3S2VM15_9PROT|nr:phosphonate ABC transporter substrate-binding protein [Hwanghaeella grinnelliae]RVU33630.1 phosphonate ABC transporter substrate-binding protein [Hwanghaeella grinnelliae]